MQARGTTRRGRGESPTRYHRYRLISRRAAKAVGPTEDIASYHREYGVNLGRGAIVMLVEEEGKPFIHLVHIMNFSIPGTTPEMLQGEVALPPMTHLDWADTARPKDDLLALAARSLGPLPEDLVPSLLPKALDAGGDAYALATQAFAHWLGGLPLPEVAAAAAPARPGTPTPSSEPLPMARKSSTQGLIASLRGLWARLSIVGGYFGNSRAGGGGDGGSSSGEHSVQSPEKGELGDVDVQGPSINSRLTEAWAEFGRRVADREPAYHNDVEREWFDRYLLK